MAEHQMFHKTETFSFFLTSTEFPAASDVEFPVTSLLRKIG